MFIENTADSKLIKWLDKGIICGIFLFALASLTSKGASSVGVGLACLLWLIRIVVTKNYEFVKTKLNQAILIFIGGLLISVLDIWQGDFFDGIDKILLAILFYYAVINTVNNLETIKKLTYTTIFSMLVSLGYGFYQNFVLDARRVNGFSFSLSYGGLLAIFLLFAIVYLLWSDFGGQKKSLLSLMSIMMGLNLLFTLSRGAWLALLGGLASLVWLKDKRWLIGLGIAVVILALILPQPFIDRFESSFDLKNNRSNITRLKLWKGAWLIYQDHPINGVGVGYFRDEFEKNYAYLDPYNMKHAHNNFFHFLATTGTVGFLAFCWLIWSILKYLYDQQRDLTGDWGLFVLASLGAIVVFNIQGLTEFNFGDTETIRFFWFIIALNVVVINSLIKGGQVNEN
jgi:O-antigen ligase